jgi:hypothetical protein
MTQTTTFKPEILFPKKSVLGREIIKAYEAKSPEIRNSGHYAPGIDQTKLLSSVKLPYQWETTTFTEVTSDFSRLLELSVQTPIIIDEETRRSLFRSLKDAGFDGKVHGYYTVDLDHAIKGDYNNPRQSFSFSSGRNPSLHLEYPKSLTVEDKHLYGIKVEAKVEKDWDKTQIGENEFKFLDVIYGFSLKEKKEISKVFLEGLSNAKMLSGLGQLTEFADQLSNSMIIGKYIPPELVTKKMKKEKNDVLSILESFEKSDYRAKLKEEAEERSWVAEKSKKILNFSKEKKISSDEEEGLSGAFKRLCFEEEIRIFLN